MRRFLVRGLTFIGGLFFLLEFLLPAKAPAWAGGFNNPFTPCLKEVTNFMIIVLTMAFLLGPINLVRSHVATIFHKRKGRLESSVFIAALVVGALVAGLKNPEGVPPNKFNLPYNVIFFGICMAFFPTSMAILAFYLVSAAYRAFRLNSLDAGVMMITATIVLLGQVPIGDFITHRLSDSFHLSTCVQWILTVPNNAVQRAVLIGVCGGGFAAALRLWLGLGTGIGTE